MRLNGAHVHYVIPDGYKDLHGECRPAFVVQDWGNNTATMDPAANVNLIVLRDGVNDRRDLTADGQTIVDDNPIQWETSVPHSDAHHFRSWHLPSECHHKGDA